MKEACTCTTGLTVYSERRAIRERQHRIRNLSDYWERQAVLVVLCDACKQWHVVMTKVCKPSGAIQLLD